MSDSSGAPTIRDDVYATIPTEVLKDTLRYSAFSDEALDYESTCMILSELKKREPSKLRQTPEEALRVFKAEYSGNESAFINCAYNESAQTNPRKESVNDKTHSLRGTDRSFQSKSTAQRKNHRFRISRSLGYIAAIIALILFTSVVLSTTAVGDYIRRTIVQWKEEHFTFSDRVTPVQSNDDLDDLYNALAEHGITERLAPTWIPAGFVLTGSDFTEFPVHKSVLFEFVDEAKTLFIRVTKQNDFFDMRYEHSYEEDQLYIRNEIDHHIATNEGITTVSWVYENYECIIFGDITENEAKKIIDSVYER